MTTLSDIPALAADRLITRGWLHGFWADADGHECLHQAVRMCSPVKGDGYLVSAWLEANGYGTGWNDAAGRTVDDVLYLLKGLDLRDEDMEATFGPNWRALVTLIRLLAAITPQQAMQLAAAWAAAGDAAGDAAWAAARAVTTRHLVGTVGYTQAHYDTLMAPIVAVFGPDWENDG